MVKLKYIKTKEEGVIVKKFITVLLVITAFICMATTASAEKIKWKDKGNFDFKKFDTIQITSMTPLYVDNTGFVTDTTAPSKIVALLRSALGNKKVSLSDLDELKEEPSNTGLKVIPNLEIKIYEFGYDKNWHDAWTETIYVDRKIEKKDKNGRYSYISIPVPEVIHHPAGYFYTAQVDVEFIVKNPRTGKTVYSIRDTRSRGGEQDTSGMIKRICNDFADDVTKN